jgi:hypothetical protein
MCRRLRRLLSHFRRLKIYRGSEQEVQSDGTRNEYFFENVSVRRT